MKDPIRHYWKIRLDEVSETLKANHFSVFTVEDQAAAQRVVMDRIVAAEKPRSISWGGSMTLTATGLYDCLKTMENVEIIDTFDKSVSAREMFDRRRRALLVDLFVTGTNAVTEYGQLVNLDMIGNRVGALTFGPRTVIVLVGRNKIVPDLEEAMLRIKNIVAPANAMRLDKKTPCAKTSHCVECNSPERICNTWTITEKAFPKGRIKVVLINEDLGL